MVEGRKKKIFGGFERGDCVVRNSILLLGFRAADVAPPRFKPGLSHVFQVANKKLVVAAQSSFATSCRRQWVSLERIFLTSR